MAGIRQWAFSICCTMVACGLAQILLPKSNMERLFKLCVSVFFLCCLLSPILLQKPELRVQVQEYAQEDIQRRAEQLSEVVERQSTSAVQASLEKIVADKLLEMGINYSSVAIHINTNGQNADEQFWVQVKLESGHEERRDQIRRELSAELGLDVVLE